MSVLSSQTIRKRGIFTPFSERTIHNGISYGLSHAGYDVRIAENIILTKSGYCQCMTTNNHGICGRGQGGHCFKVSEKTFSLASTIEHFEMPDDCIAYVKDKSSWARQGLSVFNTIVEPSWKGFLTLELTYHGDGMINIKAGSPIAQIVFHKLDEPTESPYSGKYQSQKAGAQPAIMEK